ncbi:2OG-Fe(II) oxygenase [Kribbella lupini]|uniref:Uncharacterized protein n=1 Tax=Kribbella lupini TaxID=291602 RepID=A0ABN2BH05_9ACTN
MNWIEELNDVGCALTPPLLTPAQCQEISGWYAEAEHFRATIDMAPVRHGVSTVRSGLRHTLGLVLHDAA